MKTDSEGHRPAGMGGFVSTHWSVVLQAGRTSLAGLSALETLCTSYWYPLYAFVRRQGHPPHAAQDLTQAFFAHLLARDFLAMHRDETGFHFTVEPEFGPAYVIEYKNDWSDPEWTPLETVLDGGQEHGSLTPRRCRRRDIIAFARCEAAHLDHLVTGKSSG